jgi:hypothetical protein
MKLINAWAAAAILFAAAQAAAQPAEPPLSEAVRAAIRKPVEALEAALAKEAASEPASDRERLESLGRIDQSWRSHMGEVKVDGLSPEDAKVAFEAIRARTEPIDRSNLATMMGLRPADGWFTISGYGKEATDAAFHIVEHGSLSAQKSALQSMAGLVARREVDTAQYAALYDRVQVGQGKPQRFGTQFQCVDHKPLPYPLEDEAKVEALRTAMKISPTFAEQVKGLAEHDARC